jgi:hypothetical protein
MAFQKGKSGNPGGRPIMPPGLREAAKAKTVEALDVLAAVMRDDKAPPAARVSAAVAILDRGWGRPAQSVQVDDKRRSVDEMSTDELMAVLTRAGAQADDLNDVEPVGSA